MNSEYNDALQRLEISERPPGTTIKRSTFPIPRKDTPQNYNFIFRNTGNMNIPKYTIPQVLILNNHNINYISEQRSSIQQKIVTSQNTITTTNSKILTATNNLSSAETGYYNASLLDDDEQMATYLAQITRYKEELNDLQNELIRLKKEIEEYEIQLKELEYDGKTTFDFPLDQQFTLAQGNRKSIAIRAVNLTACEYTINGQSYTDDVAFIASSINPWSKNNIIGRTSETFHNMPRMFPWDGQQNLTVWLLNFNTRIINSPCVRGSIELELIIDNENTYAYK